MKEFMEQWCERDDIRCASISLLYGKLLCYFVCQNDNTDHWDIDDILKDLHEAMYHISRALDILHREGNDIDNQKDSALRASSPQLYVLSAISEGELLIGRLLKMIIENDEEK